MGAVVPPKTSADDAAAAPLPVPHPVIDYEKVSRIGEGTYGVVCESDPDRQ